MSTSTLGNGAVYILGVKLSLHGLPSELEQVISQYPIVHFCCDVSEVKKI